MTKEEVMRQLKYTKEKYANNSHFYTGELNIVAMCNDVLEIVEKCEERKQGEWIIIDDGISYQCPYCENEIIGIEEDLNFCCKCGTKLSFSKKKTR